MPTTPTNRRATAFDQYFINFLKGEAHVPLL